MAGEDRSGDQHELELCGVDEVLLAERLISFDTSMPEGIRTCGEYLKAWLEARDLEYQDTRVGDLPIVTAKLGDGPVTLVLHAHYDVVPGAPEQFSPWREDGYLWGRGAYDMKGAAAVMCAVMADLQPHADSLGIAVRLVLVPDEETDEERERHGTQVAIEHGHLGDFVITGEPTDMHVGVQAKGVLDVRIDVEGRSAHSATPWLGTNAILKAMDVYETLLRLPFARESSRFFDRPSINLSRVHGGGRLNQVPDHCSIEIDIRYLPEQPLSRLRSELHSLPQSTVHEIAWRPPAMVSPTNPFVELLRESICEHVDFEAVPVGRDGSNDGVYFLQHGMPSVEFGPVGVGHHGPREGVSVQSLRQYRRALVGFVHRVSRSKEVLTGLTHPVMAPGEPGEWQRPLV